MTRDSSRQKQPRLVPVRDLDRHLSATEAQAVLRRATELNARRGEKGRRKKERISPKRLARAAAITGIPDESVRQAIFDLRSEQTVEPQNIPRKLYGASRLRVRRVIQRPAHEARDLLEDLLRRDQGLKLRYSAEDGSIWGPGDILGAVRRTLDFSGERPLLKAGSVELLVDEVSTDRCEAVLTAEVRKQRGEHLSLGGVLGATLAVPAAIAGVQDPLFYVAVLPALIVPGVGFRIAYHRSCAALRRALDELMDIAEEHLDHEPPARERRTHERVQDLKPIPRFTVPDRRGE